MAFRNRIGVFVDIKNQFHAVTLVNKTQRINYDRYLKAAIGKEGELHRAFAYGVQIDNEAASFIKALKQMGYEPRYKVAKRIADKPNIRYTNWNVGIALDVATNIRFLDTVILGSNDPELAELLYWVKEQGVKTLVYSYNIHKELRLVADQCREIQDDILDIRDVSTIQPPGQ